ncbi:hypothetical protein Tco_0335369 [Tanacetum coccineum]
MSEPTGLIPTLPTSAVQNTVGKGNDQTLEYPNRPASDAALREHCDKYYHQLLLIIAEKVHKEKTQQDKLKEVKARLNFEECSRRNSKIQEVSQHSECRTPNIRGEHERGRRSRHSRSISRSLEPTSVFSRIRRNRSESPKHRLGVRREGGVFNRPGGWKGPDENNKEGEASGKDKAMVILMVQPWQRVARQRVTQSLSLDSKISFPPLGDEDGTEGPMIIEAEIGGRFIHRMYVDGGSASEIPYEHCFNRLRSKVKNYMVPATAPLIGFSEEIIWPMGQISLLVKIGDAKHLTSTWMNFVVVRSPSPYNGIIRRPGVRKIQAVPSTAHEMLKFPPSAITQATEERIKVAIHQEYPEQTIAIGSTLTEEGRRALCGLLRRNLDIFAWKPEDMTGFRDT